MVGAHLTSSVESIRLLNKFYNIIWLTARPKSQKEITEQWLIKNNFPIKNLILVETRNQKIEILNKKPYYNFIDDMKYNYENLNPLLATKFIEKLNKLKLPYIIFNNNWKKIVEDIFKK